ncbi:MAG: hypothetical protein R3213_13270 [Flavobacteriaceae bacterium]|nr:hypothetical protein [Flavobacteriaceae bacterium]
MKTQDDIEFWRDVRTYSISKVTASAEKFEPVEFDEKGEAVLEADVFEDDERELTE